MQTTPQARASALHFLKQALGWHRQGRVDLARCNFAWAKQALYPYSVDEWGSHPDEDNDDCWTGTNYRTLDEARVAFEAAKTTADRDTRFVTLHGPGVEEIFEIRGRGRKARRDDDAQWRREIAMEAGMLHGVEAYNEAMGWD